MPSLDDTQILEMWYKCVGDLNTYGIKCLMCLSNGIKIGSPPTLERNADCVDCHKSAQHRLLSHVSTQGASQKLQVVHYDTYSPMKVAAIGGAELYFLAFVEDFTHIL